MAGEYYGAKTRTGGISGSIQPLMDYFKKKKEEAEQQEYINNLLGAYKMIQGKLNPDNKKPQPNALGQPTTTVDPTTGANVDSSYFGGESGMTPNNPQGSPREDITTTTPPVTNPNALSMDRYNKGKQLLNEFIIDAIIKTKPGMDTSKGSQLANVLQSQIEGIKPTLTRTQEDESKRTIVRDQYGNIIEEIPGKPKRKLTGKDFKITDDGYYAYWDETKQEFVKTNQKAKTTDNSLGRDRLNFEKGKYEEEKSKEEKDAQAKYNAIMGSPFVDTEELIKQGLLDKKNTVDKQAIEGGKGGAYVVRDDKGNAKLIFTDEELENYAKSQSSDTPNKWGRGILSGENNFIKDFEKEQGRKPSKTEIQRAKDKGYFK
jgi:hypothetical protein